MPSTREATATSARAISREPCDHWAIISAKVFASPEVVTALLIRPTATSRIAVITDVDTPSDRARTMFLGPIRFGVTQLTTISVPMAQAAAKLGVRPDTSIVVMMPSGSTKFSTPANSLVRSTASTSSVPMSCLIASILTMNATDRKYSRAGTTETATMVP